MLTLPIKQEWFDMICRGEKREEYREATEYYRTRINSAIAADPNCKGQAYKIFPVKIRAGYNSKAPAAILRVHCIFGKGGVREWGADPDKYYYILQILHIESIENYVVIQTVSCKEVVYTTLKQLNDSLPQDVFQQTHRSYIVNLEKVTAIDGNQLTLSSYKIPVARTFRDSIFNLILNNRLIIKS